MNLPNSAPFADWTFRDLADWYFAHYAANIYTDVLDRTKADAAQEVAATLDLLE